MAIQLEDIKLMASQRLTDHDDGGGHMSGTEIVDGSVSKFFRDISRLDRTLGRVSLRKGYGFVDTEDTETYSGAHAIVSVPAQDPNISVCLFSTGSDTDERTAARDRIESYVTLGPRMNAWLWGDQPAGSRTLRLFTSVGRDLPDVGSVLCLFNDKGLDTEKLQYVRITSVKSNEEAFTIKENNSDKNFDRQILQIDIGDPLEVTFKGGEITNDDGLPTTVYTTVVSDAAKYYGVMLPKEAYNKGDISLSVQSIFTHLVPAAQGESPMVDLSPGEAGPVFGSGEEYSFTVPSFNFVSGAQLHVGRAIKPGTLKIVRSAATPSLLEDNGDGVLMGGSTQYGIINYGLGTVNFNSIVSHTATAVVSCFRGVAVPVLPNSAIVPVKLANRGYNWTRILEPPPLPGTLKVDFMAQGKWFRLSDRGDEELVPDVAGSGTGTINYETGAVTLTCGALPDVDSSILYLWGNPLECVDLAGSVDVKRPEMKHTLATFPVDPGSVSIDWQTGTDGSSGDPLMAKITDNGSGLLIGDGTGTIQYSTGEMTWIPSLLPINGKDYDITYRGYPVREGSVAGSGSGMVNISLSDGDIEAGSVNLDVAISFGDYSHMYRLKDNGQGALSAPGFSMNKSVSHPTWPGSTSVSGISGTINYLTGAVTLNLSSISGTEKWRESYMKWWTPSGSAKDLQYVLKYKPEQGGPIGWQNKGVSAAQYSYRLGAAASAEKTAKVVAPDYVIDLFPGAGYIIQPESVAFSWQGAKYIDRNGKLYKNPDPATGVGVEAGIIDYSNGECRINVYSTGEPTVEIETLVGRIGKQQSASIAFRCPGAPIRPGSINFVGSLADGSSLALSSDFDGTISGTGGKGFVNYEQGIVLVSFGNSVDDDPAFASEPWYDAGNVENGKVFKPSGGLAETIKYGCVVYSYLPLDPDLIGLNPVRLPTDGRVPIVRRGDTLVIHNTVSVQLASNVASGMTITLPKVPDNLDIYDSAAVPLRVLSTKYERVGDEVTFNEGFDPADYTLPLVAMIKIEDMVLATDADITGRLTISPGLNHDYPKEGTFVSSALLFGDLQARLYGLFDQKTWQNDWLDSLEGDTCLATYNDISYPPVVTNSGAISERWALIFDSQDHFKIVGENVGVVGEGYTNQDCRPINKATVKPYFFLDYRGFGAGWAPGNVIRFNTDGAAPPFWVARTTLQGPATEPEDHFTIQFRGDVE